ncbi:hypothetical protein [Pseudomonas sp. IT-P294]|uniref:hypothetical protein n=1 Tax=Pseudomonas sp. IT-P294 TaxID=3026454 RepID=UPI0039E1F55F
MKNLVHLEAPSHPTKGRIRNVVTRTIICSDIVGAKTLYENLTGPKYAATLDEHVDLVSKCAADISADFIDVDGDSVYVVIDTSTLDHVKLATAIQKLGVGLTFGFSIGIAQGEVVSIVEGGSTRFEGVNLVKAKALARIGKAGAIYLESDLANQLSQNLHLLSGVTLSTSVQHPALPYFDKPSNVSELIWSGQAFGMKL